MPQFTWINFITARQQLAQRLADPSNIFWSDAECGVYLIDALRTFSALTEMWVKDFTFTADSSKEWYNLGTLAGSPRLRTVTDAQIYTQMQYMLLEPPTGAGAWTGTSQFTLSDLQQALQRRRDEIIQVAGCNLAELKISANAGSNRVFLPDNVLEPRRCRYIPVTGDPVTLNLEDSASMTYFEPDSNLQPASNVPETWAVVSVPPLAVETDYKLLPGDLKLIVLQSGPVFAPPSSSLMGLPDDWCWVAMYGALADLLSRESEATDRVRADYCQKRYLDGLKTMTVANWLNAASINASAVDTPSLAEIDCYDSEWETNAATWPQLVTAGVDLVAAAPVQTGAGVLGVDVTLVGNAPIPAKDSDFVQVSRDVYDVILDLAQHTASFKQGGQDFTSTISLLQNCYQMAAIQNKRMSELALYWDTMRSQGKRQILTQPRGTEGNG